MSIVEHKRMTVKEVIERFIPPDMLEREIERSAVRIAITAPDGFDLRPGAVNRVGDCGEVA